MCRVFFIHLDMPYMDGISNRKPGRGSWRPHFGLGAMPRRDAMALRDHAPIHPGALRPVAGPWRRRRRACTVAHGMFEILGPLLDVETIASGGGIRELRRLRRIHGRGRWRKLKGVARIRLEDGSIHTAEVHWYEAHGVGRREFKIKRVIVSGDA